ncbi:MAG: hypothetical protein IJ000_07185 [Paludibacteraceae bacterium]|nr:hypothetical protein [Paludibacteraceae bacterium]
MEEFFFIGIVLVISGVLQIILFFKIWGMCNDIRELRNKFSPEKKSPTEINDIDAWINGEENLKKENEEDEYVVGAEVSVMVNKHGVQMGDVLIITKVSKDMVTCSMNGKTIGKFSKDELFLIK